MHTLHAEIWGKDLASELSQLFLLGCMHLKSVARGVQESDKHTPLHVVWATQLGLKVHLSYYLVLFHMEESKCESVSRSVVSDSLRPHGL